MFSTPPRRVRLLKISSGSVSLCLLRGVSFRPESFPAISHLLLFLRFFNQERALGQHQLLTFYILIACFLEPSKSWAWILRGRAVTISTRDFGFDEQSIHSRGDLGVYRQWLAWNFLS